MTDILVIGLAGLSNVAALSDLVAGRSVHVRHTAALPAGVVVDVAYDHACDDADLTSVAVRIAADIVRAAQAGPVAYLVPGWARLGDATVAELAQNDAVTLHPDILASNWTLQHSMVVDALILAAAHTAAPFHAGLVAIDAQQSILVTNWHDEQVISHASDYLKDIYGNDIDLTPDAKGMLSLKGEALLSGGSSFAALRQVYSRLRRADGCPWDREQSELSTVPHVIEEARELQEALESQDWPNAAEELGDILGNVLMIAQIATERGTFTFEDVVSAVSAKLVRRHPHVFGDQKAASPEDVLKIWNAVKKQERDMLSHVRREES